MRRQLLYASLWLLAAAIAIGIGVAAVYAVGDAVRGRGPLGGEVVRADGAAEGMPHPGRPDPNATVVTRRIHGDYGTFVVSCQGAFARGEEARAASGSGGWRVIRFEPGPDDDVDAVFSSRRESVELEVFCNRGRPTIAEVERDRLPDD